MKKFILLLLPFLSFGQDKPYTVDTTGKVFVVFMTNDSTGQVYQGKHTTFTSDGTFAKDLASFNLKFKGFSRFIIKGNDNVHGNTPIIPVPPIAPIIPIVPIIPIDPIVPIVPIEPILPIDPPKDLFPNVTYSKNTYFLEPLQWDYVKNNKPNVSNMNGYDFAPMVANQESKYKYTGWQQNYIANKGKDVWEDNGTYFLKPKGYYTNLSSNLMDFDLRFPDFSLPRNKIVVIQPTPLREKDNYNYLNKGVSYVKNMQGSKGYSFISDQWLIDLGCPPAYGVSQEVFDKWCNDVDGDKLLQSFISSVYYPNRYDGYVMLNWEHVGHRWNVRKDKIIRCLEYWKNSPHTAKMALWTVSSVSMGKPVFQGFGLDFSDILTFDGSIDELREKYGTFMTADDSYAKYVEIAQVGGYMNYPIDDGVIHHYLFELILNKKYTKKQVLSTFWFDQELINNFDLEWVKVDSKDGSYFSQVKPRVFPSVAFNMGVWSLLGDGIDLWSDPNYWTDKKEYWGWGSKDLSGKDLPNKFDEFGSKYPSQPMKNVDWIMSGVWAMSQNKDIIEYNSEWKFQKLPTLSYHTRTPLIAYKVMNGEALVLAYDGFCEADAKQSLSVEINGKSYTIKTYGRYTSVIRIKL